MGGWASDMTTPTSLRPTSSRDSGLIKMMGVMMGYE